MSLHVANKMDEVEAAVWWDLSRIVRHFEREGMKRNEAKQAVLNAALRLINDGSGTVGEPSQCVQSWMDAGSGVPGCSSMKLGWSFFVGKHLFGIECCSDVEALDVLTALLMGVSAAAFDGGGLDQGGADPMDRQQQTDMQPDYINYQHMHGTRDENVG